MRLFGGGDFVNRMCRRSGRWIITGHEVDSYDLRSNDLRSPKFLSVRDRHDCQYVMFMAVLPLRFPLDRTPSGLFARLLIRNIKLKYSHWNLDLRGSYESWAYLYAQWPKPGMTSEFFDSVCVEMTEEISSFHQELRDKFQGDWMPSARAASAMPDSSDIRFIEPVPNSLPRTGRPALFHRS